MMVFNQKQKLTYANSAFTLLYEQPWQMFRLASPKLLGLKKTASGWKLDRKGEQWQVSQSEFIDAGEEHFLLVFTNIGSALRASQLTAWQQIIRVMGHEIRNSLTPVSSLAESLSSRMNTEREQKALFAISERCHHLQDFVDRYSSLSQKLELDKQPILIAPIFDRIKGLFTTLELVISKNINLIYADATFIEQVFINIIKNAKEAGATSVFILLKRVKSNSVISIKDNGHGFANIDNLFVPLFTTKQQGQGIGLTFCRNIVEQHQGTIDLKNNNQSKCNLNISSNSTTETQGVTVTIMLPAPPQ